MNRLLGSNGAGAGISAQTIGWLNPSEVIESIPPGIPDGAATSPTPGLGLENFPWALRLKARSTSFSPHT